MEFELKNKKTLDIERTADDAWLIDGEEQKADLVQIAENEFHLLMDSKGYKIYVESMDASSRTAVLRINGERLELRAKGKYESLLESLGMDMATSAKAKDLKAPMPGLVVDIPVKAGDEIQAGDSLIILEAMKMENVIKADAAGVVKEVTVGAKDSVEKGQVLITFES